MNIIHGSEEGGLEFRERWFGVQRTVVWSSEEGGFEMCLQTNSNVEEE